MLGGTGLLDIAHAAMDQDGLGGDLVAQVGEPRLDDGGEQRDPAGGQCARHRIGMALARVEGGCRPVGERAHRGDLRLHRHEHAPDVGVRRDGHRLAAARALDAAVRVGPRLLPGPLGQPQPLMPDG